jgi:hypothetical protein
MGTSDMKVRERRNETEETHVKQDTKQLYLGVFSSLQLKRSVRPSVRITYTLKNR